MRVLFVKSTNTMTEREIEPSRIIVCKNVVVGTQIKIKGCDGYAVTQ